MKISLTLELEKLLHYQVDRGLYGNWVKTEIRKGVREADAKDFLDSNTEDVISRSLSRNNKDKICTP